MKRTTGRLLALNAALAPTLRSTADPDAVFAKILDKAIQEHQPQHYRHDGRFNDLRQLLRFFATVPGLSPIGWKSFQDLVKNRIENELRLGDLRASKPEIFAAELPPPIIVAALPRTGTTLTHRLLAEATDTVTGLPCRGQRLWEMYNVGVDADRKTERRLVRQTQKRLDMSLQLSPTWNLIHPVNATDYEENYFLLRHTPMHLAAAPIPGYAEFLFGTDPDGPAYDARADFTRLKEMLQVLAWGREAAVPVLKHPGNIFFLREILTVFPDARIVWTHRDPLTVMGSMCSMAESLHLIHCKPPTVDPHAIGQRWLELLSTGIRRAREANVGLPRSSVRHLDYALMMSDAHQRVPELFEQLGLRWDGSDERRLTTALAAPRDQRRHEYELSRYGIDADDVDAAFGDYTRMVSVHKYA